MSQPVLIAVTDKAHQYSANVTIHLLWNDFSDQKNVVSLSSYVETHSNRLRKQFADFVESVASKEMNEQEVSEHLLIRDDFSYWWMTLFAGTRWDPSSHISDALKMFALREILEKYEVSSVTVQLGNPRVSLTVSHLLRSLHISTASSLPNRLKTKPFRNALKSWFSLFRFALTHFTIKPIDTNTGHHTLVVDHFVRFDEQNARLGNFKSQYWQPLHTFLTADTSQVSWLHHFVPGKRSLLTTEQIMKGLRSAGKNNHFQFESRLTLSQAFRVVRDLRKLREASRHLQNLKSLFVEEDTGINFAGLFWDQWIDSLCGSTATRHLIILNQMEDVFRSLPKQSLGLFLCENQPWESALSYAWATHGHGKLVAVVHAPIRYWDFRYLTLARALSKKCVRSTSKPLPSFVAVNSKISTDFMLAASAEERVIEVESLLFDHLIEQQPTFQAPRNVLLVIGDFFPDQNIYLISMLTEALRVCSTPLKVIFKPHPINNVIPKLESIPNAVVSHKLLGDLLSLTHTAVTCNSSTAALECFASGVSTISVLDPEILNSSPIRSVVGASFVSSAAQLAEAIMHTNTHKAQLNDLIILDAELPRWKSLFN
jgi:surface carbohydrate biosynthesis protein (TIGR04326 family)